MQLEQPQADYNGKPQTEDGFLRIANELMEAIYEFDFSKRQFKILLCIMRKTYGYNKKSDDMTVNQLALAINLDRASVSRALDELVSIGAVMKRHGKYGYVLELNKHYKQWKPVTKHHDRDKTSQTPCQNVTEAVTKRHTQKTTPKDNTKRQAPSPAFVLPDWINADDWSLWLKTRKGKKMIPEQMQKQINKLSKWRNAGLDYGKALSEAAENGWQGLFEPKGKSKDSVLDEWIKSAA